MKRKRLKIFFMVAVIVFIVILCSIFSWINIPEVYVYNTEEAAIYLKNNGEIVLKEVYAPSFVDAQHIVGVFDGDDRYVGIYNIESAEYNKLFAIELFAEFMDKEVSLQEITNIRLIPEAANEVSFIYEGGLYRYRSSGKFEQIREFQKHYPVNAYEWIDETSFLYLDDMGVLDEWSLYFYDMKGNVVEKLEERVSAFSHRDNKVYYGKKEYEGAWCEWNMLVMSIEEQEVENYKKSSVLDIGEIFIDDDRELYYMESSAYRKNYDRRLYKIDLLWGRRKVMELEENERILGVY